MRVVDVLATVLAIGIRVVPVVGHWTGAIQRNQRDHIFEPVRLEAPQQCPHGCAFELEDADRVALGQEIEGRLIGEIDVVDIRPDAGAGVHELEATLDGGQGPQPEEIHLEETQFLDPVHLVLGDDLCAITLLLYRGRDRSRLSAR